MASTGLVAANSMVDHTNGDDSEKSSSIAQRGESNDAIGAQQQQHKINKLDRLDSNDSNYSGSNTSTSTNILGCAKRITTGKDDVTVSCIQETDKTQQRTSNSAVQDIKGSDNDKSSCSSGRINDDRRRNEMKSKQHHAKAQTNHDSCLSTNETHTNNNNSSNIDHNNNNHSKTTNDKGNQQRRESKTSKETQQRSGSDATCSGTSTVSKFKEKRPEPLKLSSSLNQEIPLDLSVRSATNVPTDASGSVFGLLCANQLTTLETPRILWQDNELLMDTGVPNTTSSTSMILSPLPSSGIPVDHGSKLRLFSSTSSSASMTMISQRNLCADRNIPMSAGLPITPLPLTPASPITSDSITVAAATAHLAAANRLASMAVSGVGRHGSSALTTSLPISPARTHHLARNLVTSTGANGWLQPPRRSCSTENLSSLLTSASALKLIPSPRSSTTTTTKSSLASAAAARKILDMYRYQHQKATSDLLGASLDHSGIKRISPLATNSLTAPQHDRLNVTSNNVTDAADSTRSHSSTSSSSGSRFSYSSQQIAAARLAQRLQQHQQHPSTLLSSWNKNTASILSPGGIFDNNNNHSANVSPITPTNVANATANLLNIRLNSPNSSSNNSTSNIDSLGSVNNDCHQQQKPMSVSFSSLSDLLAASSTMAAAATANIAQVSPTDSTQQHQYQHQHCPMTTAASAFSPIIDPLMSSATFCQSSGSSSSTLLVGGGGSGSNLSGGCSTASAVRQGQHSNANNLLSGCASGGSNSTTLNTPTLISPNQLKAGHLCFLPSPTLSPLSSVFELPSPLLMFPPTTSTIPGNGTGNSICRDEPTKNNVASSSSTSTSISPKGINGTSNPQTADTMISAGNVVVSTQSSCSPINVVGSEAVVSSVECSPVQPAVSVGTKGATLETSANHLGPMRGSLNTDNDRDKHDRYDAQANDPFAQLITPGEHKVATTIAESVNTAGLESKQVESTSTTNMEVDANDVNDEEVREDGDDNDGDRADDDDEEDDETDLDNCTEDDNADECAEGVGGPGYSVNPNRGTRRHHLRRLRCRDNSHRRRCGGKSPPWPRMKTPKQTITKSVNELASQRLFLQSRPATAVPQIFVSESSRSQQHQQQTQQNLLDCGATLINASSLNTGLNRIWAQQQRRYQRDSIDKRALSPKSFRARINLYHNKRSESSSAPPEVVMAMQECTGPSVNSSTASYGQQTILTPKAKIKTLSTIESCDGSSSNTRMVQDERSSFGVPIEPSQLQQSSPAVRNGQQPSVNRGVYKADAISPTRSHLQQHTAAMTSVLPFNQNSLPSSLSVENISATKCSTAATWNSIQDSCYQQQQQHQKIPRATNVEQHYYVESSSSGVPGRVNDEPMDVNPVAGTQLPSALEANLTTTGSILTTNSGSLAMPATFSLTQPCPSGNQQTGFNSSTRIPNGGCCATILSSSTTNSEGCSSLATNSRWLSHSAHQLSHQAATAALANSSLLHQQNQQLPVQRAMTSHWLQPNSSENGVPVKTSSAASGIDPFGSGCSSNNSALLPARAASAQMNVSNSQSMSLGEQLHRCGSVNSTSIVGCARSAAASMGFCALNPSGISSPVVANPVSLPTSVSAHWLDCGSTNAIKQQQTSRNQMVADSCDSNVAFKPASMATMLHAHIEPYATRSMGELTSGKGSNLDGIVDCTGASFESHAYLERSMQQYSLGSHHQRGSNQSVGGDCSPTFDSSRRGSSMLSLRTTSATPTKMMAGHSIGPIASAFNARSETALTSATAAAAAMAIGAVVTSTCNSRPDSVASINSSISLDLESFKNVGLSSARNSTISLTSTPKHHISQHNQAVLNSAQHQQQHQQNYSNSRPSSVASNNTQLSGGSSSCMTIRRGRHCLTPQNRTGSSASSCGSGGAPKKYHCDQCSKSFTRSDMLTRHRRLHSGDRPFQCNECKQEFSRSDHLSTHMRTHTGEKPYKCKLCCYSACRKDMITRHMKVHNRNLQAQLQHVTKHHQQQTTQMTTPAPILTPSHQSLQLLYNQQHQL